MYKKLTLAILCAVWLVLAGCVLKPAGNEDQIVKGVKNEPANDGQIEVTVTPGVSAETALSAAEQPMIGIWQASPILGGAWGDTFQFFGNRRFIFNYNKMDCERRDISFEGRWQVTDGKLVLDKDSETEIIGGTFQPDPVCGVYIGGREEIKIFEAPERIEYDVSPISPYDATNDLSLPNLLIGSQRYWQLRTNPSDF